MIDWLIFYKQSEATWPPWMKCISKSRTISQKKGIFDKCFFVSDQCFIIKIGDDNFQNFPKNYDELGMACCRLFCEPEHKPRNFGTCHWKSFIDVTSVNNLSIHRDLFGKSQLYVRQYRWGWVVSTSLPLLFRYGPRIEIARENINEYIFYDAWTGKNLPFENVYQVPIGEKWTTQKNSFSVTDNSWFEWFDLLRGNEKQCVHKQPHLGSSLRNVIRQLPNDKKYGIFLSGGFDSSLLASICRREGLPVTAFTCQVLDSHYDESQKAKLVASNLGIELHVIPLDKNLFLTGLVDAIYRTGLPLMIPNQVGLSVVARYASSYGIDVMLCGEGADELFQGYPRLLELRDQLTTLLHSNTRDHEDPDYTNWELLRESFLTRSFADLVRFGFGIPGRLELLSNLREVFSHLSDPIEEELRIAWLMEIFATLPNNLLRLNDAVKSSGMAIVLPYLSKDTTNCSFSSLPKLSLLSITKPLIRDLLAAEKLPSQILNQPKQGFDIPIDIWLPQWDASFGKGIEFIWGTPKKQIFNWARQQPLGRDLKWALYNLDIWSQLVFLNKTKREIIRCYSENRVK
jgi:asparagine synthase (glutamine-hydrolysing)